MIHRAERFLGVKFWAQYFSQRVPRYEVFRYYGYQPATGAHFFEKFRSPRILLGMTEQQLVNSMFKPFCVDDALIRETTGAADL